MRLCGVCKRCPREDDLMGLVRLHADDLGGEKRPDGSEIVPGLYHSCTDCIEKYRGRIAARLMKTPAVGDDGRGVFDADGNPVMTIQRAEQAVGDMLQ